MNFEHRQRTRAFSGLRPCRDLPVRETVTILLGLLLWVSFGPGGGAFALPQGMDNCPLVNHTYKAMLAEDQLTGTVGEKIILSFTLEPPRLLQGFFVSVNMKKIQSPKDLAVKGPPEILTGFPQTYMVFHTPGVYRYTVIVSMISKGSCGGVKADTLFKGDVEIRISQALSIRAWPQSAFKGRRGGCVCDVHTALSGITHYTGITHYKNGVSP